MSERILWKKRQAQLEGAPHRRLAAADVEEALEEPAFNENASEVVEEGADDEAVP